MPAILEALPPARSLSRSAVARARISDARAALAVCRLCVHDCRVDRLTAHAGKCHSGASARVFSAQTEVADELELLPTFAVALSGCNLRCDFCITGASSWNARAGEGLDPDDVAGQARRAIAAGARTVMILGGEPTIHLPALLELIAALPDEARVVLKTNACFSAEARPFLADLFDVWLPDFKFGNDACALRLAGIDGYVAAVTDNLLWMCACSESARPSSLVVRHLLMPGHVDCCWAPVAAWLAKELPGARVSLRSGYWPAWHAGRHPELGRRVVPEEWRRASAIARRLDLELVP